MQIYFDLNLIVISQNLSLTHLPLLCLIWNDINVFHLYLIPGSVAYLYHLGIQGVKEKSSRNVIQVKTI